jgi:hypothetical protein
MQNGSYTTYSSPSPHRRRRRRRQRARRRLLLLVPIVVIVAVAAAAVVLLGGRGGEGSGAGTGGDDQASGQTTPTHEPSPATPPPQVWVASKTEPVRVWVGGDSMGGELGLSLAPLLQDTGVFKPVTFYKVSSGICRYDFFDWRQQVEAVVKTAKPQAAVIMMGTNDTQSVSQDGGRWIPYGDMAWKRAYEKRVGDIIDAFLDGGVRRVYWVGMPIMGEDWRNSRMRLINKVFQKQSEKRAGAEYVDIWDLYTTSDGSFDASLRLGDGVHFTVEGQGLLADEVYRAIEADWLPPGSEPSGSPEARPSASSPSP